MHEWAIKVSDKTLIFKWIRLSHHPKAHFSLRSQYGIFEAICISPINFKDFEYQIRYVWMRHSGREIASGIHVSSKTKLPPLEFSSQWDKFFKSSEKIRESGSFTEIVEIAEQELIMETVLKTIAENRKYTKSFLLLQNRKTKKDIINALKDLDLKS